MPVSDTGPVFAQALAMSFKITHQLQCCLLLLSAACGSSSGDDAPDSGVEAAGAISGNITLTASCEAGDSASDCVGTLYVGVFDPSDSMMSAHVYSTTLDDTDLSNGGPISYQIDGVEPGNWYVAAFLDDDSNADAANPLPDEGDPVGGVAAHAVTVTSNATTTQDHLLMTRLSSSSEYPLPPSNFSCPSPGGSEDPLYQQLVSSDWYYVANTNSCEPFSWQLFHFDSSGVFWIRLQSQQNTPTGEFAYGCWSYQSDGAERITIAYDYPKPRTLNCLSLGRSTDGPCTAVLDRVDNDSWVQGESLEIAAERHVFRRIESDSCGFCSDDVACCSEPGWVEDASGAICPE